LAAKGKKAKAMENGFCFTASQSLLLTFSLYA